MRMRALVLLTAMTAAGLNPGLQAQEAAPPTPTEPAIPPPSPADAEGARPPPTPEQTAAWIRALGADEFDAREEAMHRLMEAGEAVREAVQAAREDPDPEVRWRTREVLTSIRWHCSPELYAHVGSSLAAWPAPGNDTKEALQRDLDQFATSGPSPVIPVCIELLREERDPRFLAAWWRIARSKAGDDPAALLRADAAPGGMLALALKVLRATRSAGANEYSGIAHDFAELLRSLGFDELAGEGFVDELATGGGDAGLYRRCADALAKAGCPEDALIETQKAAFLRPDDGEGWDRLSRLAESAGQIPIARSAAIQACLLAPDNAERAARKAALEAQPAERAGPAPAPRRLAWEARWSRLGNPRDDPAAPPAADARMVVWARNYNDRSELVAVDAARGTPLWTTPLVGPAPPPRSVGETSIETRSTCVSCTLGPEFVYVLIRTRTLILRSDTRRRSDLSGWKGESADLCAIERTSGRIAWKTRLEDPGEFQPLLPPAGGVLVLACPVHLHAIDMKSGAIRWKRYVGTEIIAPPLVVGELACVATGEPEVRGYGTADGTVKWSLALERIPARRTGLAETRGSVCVADREGGVTAFDPASGQVRWSTAPSGWLRTRSGVCLAATADRVAVATTPEGRVTCIDAATGKTLWSIRRFGCQPNWMCAAGPFWIAGGPQMGARGIAIADGAQRWTMNGSVPLAPAVGGGRLGLFSLGEVTPIRDRINNFGELVSGGGTCTLSVFDLDAEGKIARRCAALTAAAETFAAGRDFPAAAECTRLMAEVADGWDVGALRRAAEWTSLAGAGRNDPSAVAARELRMRFIASSDPTAPHTLEAVERIEEEQKLGDVGIPIARSGMPLVSPAFIAALQWRMIRRPGEEGENVAGAMGTLATLPGDAAIPLLVDLAADGADPTRRFLAANALAELGRIGDDRPFREGLLLDSADWRRRAAERLASFDRPGVREALRPLLNDADPAVRRAAAWSLATLRDASGREVLRSAIEGDQAILAEETGERWDMAVALCKIGDPKGVQVLRGILEAAADGVDFLDAQVATKLLEFEGAELAPAVQALLTAGGRFIRLFGLGYLERNGTPDSAPALLEFASGEEDEDTRLTAAKAALDLCTPDQLEEVRTLLDRQAASEGSHVDWRLLAARAARLAGDTEASEAACAQMAEVDPERIEVWQEWADTLLRRREYAKAEEKLRPRLEIDPEGGNSISRLSLMYAVAKQGRIDEAQALLETALDLAPGDVSTVYNNASWAWCAPPDASAAEAALALALADRACALDPENPYSTGTRGTALYRLGRFAEAEKQFERSSSDPTYTRLGRGTDSFFLALSRWRLGRPDEARAAAARAAALDPKSEFAKEWEARDGPPERR